MSLASLLRTNFITIEMLSGDISVDTDGAFEGQWIPIEAFKNMRGHVQEKKKATLMRSFGTIEENHSHVMYHRSKALYEYAPDGEVKQVRLRVITAIDPRKPLTFPVEQDTAAHRYEWMGQIQQVTGVRAKATFYIIKANRINHLQLA
jgi:hypothetical protein